MTDFQVARFLADLRDPDVEKFGDILFSMRNGKDAGRQVSSDNDVGRRVFVLWIPHTVPKHVIPPDNKLKPYPGVVARHIPGRKNGTHYVKYEDGTAEWHTFDELLFK